MSTMNISSEQWDADYVVDQLIKEHDSQEMPIPDLEHQPHLLISKVRKHYMEYLIKLLATNYETNQKLLNKNIYLPSAIWRCAKSIETSAAQACMVIQIYRQNIVQLVKELKNDTKKGKLHRKLYECLHNQPVNEKKLQTTLNLTEECTCECRCKGRKKRRKISESPRQPDSSQSEVQNEAEVKKMDLHKIPVILNSQIEPAPVSNDSESIFTENENQSNANVSVKTDAHSTRMSVESQGSDDLMMQLEKLFQGDPNDDDLFEGTFCDSTDYQTNDSSTVNGVVSSSVLENHSNQIKSLDERLASLSELLANPVENNTAQAKADTTKDRGTTSSKWLCEEYFLKTRFYEKLDEIGDTNRKKLIRVKDMIVELFGEDSDDEGVVSPLDETPDFVASCKGRMAPWVVKVLTPFYMKGRIRGKALFKSLAKHLIRLIYQCSKYPNEQEVHSFVKDFINSHKMIRCEADFKQFRIENI